VPNCLVYEVSGYPYHLTSPTTASSGYVQFSSCDVNAALGCKRDTAVRQLNAQPNFEQYKAERGRKEYKSLLLAFYGGCVTMLAFVVVRCAARHPLLSIDISSAGRPAANLPQRSIAWTGRDGRTDGRHDRSMTLFRILCAQCQKSWECRR